jgi:hypothetical protein
VASVRLVAVVPAHTIADGEYDDLAAGRLAALGFALQEPSASAAHDRGVIQVGEPVPTTTITGTVLRPGDEVPPLLDAGHLLSLLASAHDDWTAGAELAVTGRLVVEPYLWATDGMLWPLVPDGVRMWTVEGIRRVDEEGIEHLATLPGPAGLDHGATYLLDLSGIG